MKNHYFAEFYQYSTGYKEGSIPPIFDEAFKKPVPVCGDKGVIIIDGRLSQESMEKVAAIECRKRGGIGYKLHYGTFSRPKRSTNYKHIEGKTSLELC